QSSRLHGAHLRVVLRALRAAGHSVPWYDLQRVARVVAAAFSGLRDRVGEHALRDHVLDLPEQQESGILSILAEEHGGVFRHADFYFGGLVPDRRSRHQPAHTNLVGRLSDVLVLLRAVDQARRLPARRSSELWRAPTLQ